MPNYRRNRVAGGTYFFTLALADRRSDLLVKEVTVLRASVSRALALYPFSIDAWVVLPDHLHAVWTLPEGNADFSTRWTLIKRGFSARIAKGEGRSASRIGKGERGIWQRRFWEHTVRGEADFARHVDYVHFNPVKHGFVGNARDWPFSSFRRPWHVGIIQRIGEMEKMLLASSVRGRTGDGRRQWWGAKEHPTVLYSLIKASEKIRIKSARFPRCQLRFEAKI